MDAESNYIEGIKSAWLGEQFGEVFFNALANAAADDAAKDRWKALAQLEVVTGKRMAALLQSHGETASTDIPIEIPDEILSQYTQSTFEESMTHMKETIEDAIARYDQLLAIAPEDDVSEVQFLVDHELALLDFVERELEGNHAHSLDRVKALIAAN